jgi:beta-N-acetylhexosaminidase
MPLRDQIGQLVHCGFHGYEPSEEIVRLIRERRIGGVILFARNVRDIRQVASLTAKLQRIAAEAGVPELAIAIDQEGGMLARLTEGVALMPGNMAIAAGGSPEAAFEAARVTGEELRALGITLNYAPVLDVNINPANPVIGVRSYGESPKLVGEFGVQAIRGLQLAGVAATAKHFPGHGDTDVDSHLDLPTVAHSRQRIREVELEPFRQAIAAGVDAIMTSHIVFPAFENGNVPATLSRRLLTGLLREELGFGGVIMTDCMEMKAIADHFGTVEAAVMAMEAGADCVLISHTHRLQEAAIDAIAAAVRSGRLSRERIAESAARLLAMKRRRAAAAASAAAAADADGAGMSGSAGSTAFAAHSAGDFRAPEGSDPIRRVGCREHREVARRISEASVTLVKNEGGLLPLRRERTLVISVAAAAVSEVDESVGLPVTLGQALDAEGIETEERIITLDRVAEHVRELTELAKTFAQVVVGTYNASLHRDQAALVGSLLDAGVRPVVVALRNPYDINGFPSVPAYVLTYESRPLALRSAAKVLAGALKAKGRTPVSISPDYPAGWGGGGRCSPN